MRRNLGRSNMASPYPRGPRATIAAVAGLMAGLASVSCGVSNPRLTYEALKCPAMGERNMDYAVYTPPGWTPEEQLPLVVFLHGAGDDPRAFDRNSMSSALDEAVRTGDIPRAVIVLPEGNLGFWSNWFDRSRMYEDWVVEDLMPVIRRTYNTKPCPEHCHVMGISMGGYGALKFAQHRPDRFSSAASLSAPIFDTEAMTEIAESIMAKIFFRAEQAFGPADPQRIASEDLYVVWQEPRHLWGVRLFLAWGDRERAAIADGNAKLSAHLQAHKIPHDSHVFSGGHDWPAWKPVVLQALRFHLWGAPHAQNPPPGLP